jgi:hypothetical protein
VALGYFDPKRMTDDYNTVAEVFKVQPFVVTTAYTNDFLDKSVKMPK